MKHNFLRNLLKSESTMRYNLYRNLFPVSLYVILSGLFFILVPISCSEFAPKNEKVIARVGEVYLYASDFEDQLVTIKDRSDSLLRVRNYIDNWAKDQLLIQLAERNLKNESLIELEELVSNYRAEIYSNTYLQSVVNNTLDTLLTAQEIDSFLYANKAAFKLNTPLYKVRYIHLPPDNVDQDEIQRSFERFNKEDRLFLDSLSFQFYNFLLADSIWLNKRDLTNEVIFLNNENAVDYLKKSKFFRVEDSLGVYLLYIKDFLEKGNTAPRILVESTIKNIILNQKKLKFIKQFENDILRDALQSKNYEIY